MEILRELLPFFLGMLVIPPLMIVLAPQRWSGRLKFIITLVLAVVVGFVGSTIVGEQIGDLSERIAALIIDTSTAYAGSQLAYWLFWKYVLETRVLKRASA